MLTIQKFLGIMNRDREIENELRGTVDMNKNRLEFHIL